MNMEIIDSVLQSVGLESRKNNIRQSPKEVKVKQNGYKIIKRALSKRGEKIDR